MHLVSISMPAIHSCHLMSHWLHPQLRHAARTKDYFHCGTQSGTMALLNCNVSSNQFIWMVTDVCNSKQYRIAQLLSPIGFGIKQLAIVGCCANANLIIASIETVWWNWFGFEATSAATKFHWPQVSLDSKMQTIRLKQSVLSVAECEWCSIEWKWWKRRTQKPIHN